MKSYVTLTQTICPICGNKKDTGEILLDTRLQDKFEQYTVVGYKVCTKCTSEPNVLYILSSDNKGNLLGPFIKTTKDVLKFEVEGNVVRMLPENFNMLG